LWNDGKSAYNAYRETINFDAIESVSLWCNNLPPGKAAKCVIGAIKGLPMAPCTLKQPAVTVNGQRFLFPVDMPSGGYLEFSGMDDCTLYGSKGETLAKVSARGQPARLRHGPNQVRFECQPNDGPPARAKVVVVAHGEPLGELVRGGQPPR
jgi:hypothetical protein